MTAPGDPQADIRVFVVDDHAVVRRGIRSFLEMVTDVEVVGEAGNGREAVDQVASLSDAGRAPDVVLMDIVMPEMDGITATRALRDRFPEINVVAMTSFSEADKVQGALEAGATGYLLKDADADELARAIRAAHRGDVHVDGVVAKQLARALTRPSVKADVLSQREREVLRLLAAGLSNQAIASELFISERTARSHVSSILGKLALPSRTQAALWAVREGLGPPDPPR